MSPLAEGEYGMNLSHTIYEHQVDDWIQDAFAQGATTLEAVVAVLPGVYPTVVRDAVQRVAPQIVDSGSTNVQHVQRLPRTVAPFPPLPTPHPLDYDWRFHDDSVINLLRRVDTIAAESETVVLLGTPSLLQATLAEPRPYSLALLDANATVVRWFAEHAPSVHVLHGMIGQDLLPNWRGRVVVADPPWYEEHIRAFLWAATQLCVVGGTILMALPPLGTRPGIENMWARTLDELIPLGLTLEKIEHSALAYDTPLFEQNALAAEGLATYNWPWRRGDLAIFRRIRETHAACPLLCMTEGTWDEVCIAGVRLRLRQKRADDFADPTLQALIDGDVLSSVSRRDPRRRNVDVWTSGNRVFACHGTQMLKLILEVYAASEKPLERLRATLGRSLTATEHTQVVIASRQIDMLLSRERRDLLNC